MNGTVGVLTGGGPPVDELGSWLERLPDSVIIRKIRGNQIPYQRNQIALEMTGDWVCYVDHDCVPPVGALEQLLAHNVSLVGGVVLERRIPFQVCATKSLEPYARYERTDIPKAGLFAVPALGTGFLLVRRAVFEAVGRPWFRAGGIPQAPDLLAEDLDFCLRAAAVGHPAYLDCGVRVRHAIEGFIQLGDDGDILAQWDGPGGGRLPFLEAVDLGSMSHPRTTA